MSNIGDSELNIDTADLLEKADETACYVGICPYHSWEGMRRDDYGEAEADLEGHIGLFPDEPHTGSRVSSC